MTEDAPKRRFLSLVFRVSCNWLIYRKAACTLFFKYIIWKWSKIGVCNRRSTWTFFESYKWPQHGKSNWSLFQTLLTELWLNKQEITHFWFNKEGNGLLPDNSMQMAMIFLIFIVQKPTGSKNLYTTLKKVFQICVCYSNDLKHFNKQLLYFVLLNKGELSSNTK